MLVLLAPDAYHIRFLDSVNAPMSNHPQIGETILDAYAKYFRANKQSIPSEVNYRNPFVCFTNFNFSLYFEYSNFIKLLV